MGLSSAYPFFLARKKAQKQVKAIYSHISLCSTSTERYQKVEQEHEVFFSIKHIIVITRGEKREKTS